MRKVLITCPCYEERCAEGLEILRANNCEPVINRNGRPYYFEELKEIIGDIDGVIAGSDFWNADVFRYAGKLKAVARFGTGIDNLNLDDFREYGIRASYCPGINRNAVSEHAFALLFSMIRDVPHLDRTTKEGGWIRYAVHELRYYTVGFFGFGATARSFAEKLQPFAPRMLAYAPHPHPAEAEALHVRQVPLDELLRESDIISIHSPCTDETRGFFNKAVFAKMKPGAYLVNTARGAIVNEADAAEALRNGTLTAYATDVFETEPVDPANPLFALDNYICTPHTAAETYENYRETGIATAQAVVAMLDGKEPANRIV